MRNLKNKLHAANLRIKFMKNGYIVNMTIEMTDHMSAESGTRASPIAGGYNPDNPVTVFPDEPIWAAIQKMSPRDLARLPVISRDGSGKLVGLISRSDILRAYDVGVVRKQRGQIVEHQVDLRQSKENGFVEFVLKEEDTCSNALIKDLSLPDTINMVSIKRSGQIIIPKGHTRIKVGDVITVYGRLKAIEGIKDFLNNCAISSNSS